ncbi:uncharacterized protein LOC126681980 [Mercurialis annua]|uniref:uncharacterized protein LOC126681980 n=1 Tax=Mercurialis annua TaxID=3986 RepID=UPI002160AB99|nr:uncharacterized protein LOC126681980 [Mercurialis annua]
MVMLLDMQKVDLWHVFLQRWKHPVNKDGAPLERNEWSKDQLKENAPNRKAMATLISLISREEKSKIQHLTCAKQMWDTLEKYYEGTNRVKEKKLQLLLGEYEGFKCLPDEDVSLMITRFLGIVTSLDSLGKSYKLRKINDKILRSIEEAHDLSTFRTDELIGKLLLHEIFYFKSIQKKKSKENNVSFKT